MTEGHPGFPSFKYNPDCNAWEEEDCLDASNFQQPFEEDSPIIFDLGGLIINGITEVKEEFPDHSESQFITKLINSQQWFILRKIFMYLDEKSFQNSKLVCKSFKHVIDLMFTNSMVGQNISRNRLEQQWKMAFPMQYFINCKYRIKSVYVDGPEIFCCLENGRINIYEKKTRKLKTILRHSQFWPRLLAINDTYVISGYGCDQLKFWRRCDYMVR